VIFLTVGSDIPFSRLTGQFDQFCKNNPDQEAFAQVGRLRPGDHQPEEIKWVELLSSSDFSEMVERSTLIVAHAGMGSILTALSTRKPIVILPRAEKLRETRSDHQFATAKRFEDQTGIFVAWTESELEEQISNALTFKANQTMGEFSLYAPPAFTDRIRAFILGDPYPDEVNGNQASGS